MSSLGFLSIYSLLARRPGFSVERCFAGGDGVPLSHEGRRPLSQFPIVCASLSFENDYWIFWDILRRSGIKTPESPLREDFLIAAGGVAPWANPYPVMPITDVILTGEGEISFNDFLDVVSQKWFFEIPKKERLVQISENVRGALIPSLLPRAVRLGEGYRLEEGLAAITPVVPPRLPLQIFNEFNPPSSPIHTKDTEFSGVKLVEIGRGCPYGCRFCLAGSLYRPHRPWAAERILDAVVSPNPWDELPAFPEKAPVGLVSPAVADHPDIKNLLETLIGEGKKVSFSSLRLTALNPEIASLLAKGKVKGVALAPEAGTERLRDLINKNIKDQDVLEGVRLLADAGLSKLKLYFMIGLPGEKESDLRGIQDLTERVLSALKGKKRSPQVLISIAYFTPKPHTAFEDEPLLSEVEMRRKGEFLKKLIGPIGGVDLKLDAPAPSIVQGLLSRGGPQSFDLVDAMRVMEGKCKAALKFIGYSEIPREGFSHFLSLPWRIVAPAMGIPYLEREKEQVEEGIVSDPCPTEIFCGRCGSCEGMDKIV
jgi:radical SAM superfamily enzyme YgiQ (UPF0313 family)